MNESGDNPYPNRSQRQTFIHRLETDRLTWIAGKLSETPKGFRLQDHSGSILLDLVALDVEQIQAVKAGDIVEILGSGTHEGPFKVTRIRRLARGRSAPAVDSANRALWQLPRGLFDLRRTLRDRLRTFFLDLEFTEVESPRLVPGPGQEPFLDPFETRLESAEGDQSLYLITSPEYFHKRLLAAGYDKIFEVARVFRNGPSETRGLHHFEFTMVEWYRAFASYLEIMDDLERLVCTLAETVEGPGIDLGFFRPPFERLTMVEAFHRYANLDLSPFLANDPDFARSEARNGDSGLTPEDSLGTRFFKIFVGAVEPALGHEKPVMLVDFPASQASLSKVKTDDTQLCERFELYIKGVELANGFTELNDPQEQLRRFRHEQQEKMARGKRALPLDPRFLEALELGMPPSGGVALGFDRLVMILTGATKFRAVIPWMGG